jgi:hypothetical protein
MVNFSAGLSGSTALRLPLTTPLVLGPDWPGRSVGVWLKKAVARPERRALNGSVGCWAAAALGPAGLSGWAVDGEAAGIAAAQRQRWAKIFARAPIDEAYPYLAYLPRLTRSIIGEGIVWEVQVDDLTDAACEADWTVTWRIHSIRSDVKTLRRFQRLRG